MNEKQIIQTVIDHIKGQDYTKYQPNLYNGKMGVCIFLYVASKYLKYKELESEADDLIDEICQDCEKTSTLNHANFEYGLSGIAFGIRYLINHNYIDADPEEVLEDFDSSIFRQLSSQAPKELLNNVSTLYGMLFYLLYSIKNSTRKDSEAVQLKKELVVLIINTIESSNDQCGYTSLTNEPFVFDLNAYKFPAYLYLIAETYKLGFYDYKLDRIIDSLTTFIQSSFPRLISNRIYLLLCARRLMSVKPIPEWEEHLKLLEESIDVKAMLENEFKDKSININNGVSGLLLLLSAMPEAQSFKFCQQLTEGIIEKICNSSYFDTAMEEEKSFAGAISGSCGIALALSLYGLSKEKNTKQ